MQYRDKQIEEMAKVFCGMKNGCDGCMWGKAHCHERNYAEEFYNAGYRKQEWISVEERLPEKSGDYLTYHNGVFSTLMYSAKHRLFNATDLLPEEFCLKHNVKVSHWMPLPEAPKM